MQEKKGNVFTRICKKKGSKNKTNFKNRSYAALWSLTSTFTSSYSKYKKKVAKKEECSAVAHYYYVWKCNIVALNVIDFTVLVTSTTC